MQRPADEVRQVIDASRHRNRTAPQPSFARRVLVVLGIILAFTVVGLLLWFGREVFLLLFTGMLLAVFLRGLSDWLSDHTPLSSGLALFVVLVTLVGLLALGVWFLVPSLSEQFNQLTQALPQALRQLRDQLGQVPQVQQLLDQPLQPAELLPSGSNFFTRVTGAVSTVLGALTNLVLILFVAVYLSIDPGLYKRGLLKLVAVPRRERISVVLDTLGQTLRFWLLGQFGLMLINGTITVIGLSLLGIPLALVLGIITGVLNFIPNFGPILASVPAILIAFTQGPTQALYVALLYIAIQNLEGLILAPMVQQRTVDLPPVVVVIAQVLSGLTFGFLGILLAVPITATLTVLIKMLYIEDVLGDEVEVKGEEQIEQEHASAA